MFLSIVIAAVMIVVVLTAAIAMEQVAPIERYTLRQRLPGIAMVFAGTFLFIFAAYGLQWLWDPLGVSSLIVPLWDWLSPLGSAGNVLALFVLFVVVDFLRYWRHRVEHRWFWSLHKVHHSPTELHAANNIGHPLSAIPDFIFVSIPLSFFEFPGATSPFLLGVVILLHQAYLHSPIDIHFGPLSRVFVDNRFHRIHHSVEERHLESNFALSLSIWDQLFGTACWPARGEWPAVGVRGVEQPRTLRAFLWMPFTDLPKWRAVDSAITSHPDTYLLESPQPSRENAA